MSKEKIECIRCGNCCRQAFFQNSTAADIERWKRMKRSDLVAACREEERDYDEGGFMGLKKHRPCRFYIEFEPGKTGCAIHDVKPEICAEFEPGRSRMCPAGKSGKGP